MGEVELRGLLEIIGEVHHVEDLAAFRSAVLEVVPRVVPSSYVAYNEIGFDGRPSVAIAVPDLPPEAHAAWARLAPQNPLLADYLRTRNGRTRRLLDVVTSAELHQLELYQELYGPNGIEDQLAVILPAHGGEVMVAVVLSDAQPFSEQQAELLELARPHLTQAYANAYARERLRDVLAALSAGLEDTADAAVVVDAQGRVQFATTQGRAAVAALTGRELADGDPLPEPLQQAGHERVVLPLADGGAPVVVRRVHARESAFTVLIFERGSRGVSRTQLGALGLTPRETEVLRSMMRGQSTEQMASALAISVRTVHKHAERIYAKLGVRDRIGAVSAAWAALTDE